MRVIGLLAIGLALAGCAKSDEQLRLDLHDDDPYARLMAVVALGRSGRADAGPDLLAALEDERPEVRAAAHQAVVALGPAAVPSLLDRVASGAMTASDADLRLIDLALVYDPALRDAAPMMRTLRGGRYDRGAVAIFGLLGEIGTAAVAPLADALRRPDPLRSAAAADALGTLGPASAPASSALLDALDRPEPEVVRACAAALGRIGATDEEVLTALLAVARDAGSPAVRQAALDAAVGGLVRRAARGEPARGPARAELAGLGQAAFDGLLLALRFDEQAVADEAAGCLAALGPQRLPQIVASLPERDATQLGRGAQVVRGIGAPALAPLLEMIGDPANPARVRAVAVLSGLGAEAAGAWPALFALLGDGRGDLAAAAAYALGGIPPADDRALSQLIAARARGSRPVGRLLLPAIVAGLLARGRLAELAALGDAAGVEAELRRLARGRDPDLCARARAALGPR